MAAPHVTGVVALLMNGRKYKAPAYKTVYNQLIGTTLQKGVGDAKTKCDDVAETEFPNHSFGHGIADALGCISKAPRKP